MSRIFYPSMSTASISKSRHTNEINHRNSKITERSLGRPCAGTACTDATCRRRFSADRQGGIMANDKNLIIVDAPSRLLFEAYGRPPFLPQPSEDIGLNSPRCTPSREDTTVADWYAEQERMYGKVAAIKAKRPKTLWQRVTSREEPEPEQEPAKQEPLQLPARQQPQLSVQQQIRQRLQLTDKSNAIPTETEDGIYWIVFEGEKQDA